MTRTASAGPRARRSNGKGVSPNCSVHATGSRLHDDMAWNAERRVAQPLRSADMEVRRAPGEPENLTIWNYRYDRNDCWTYQVSVRPDGTVRPYRRGPAADDSNGIPGRRGTDDPVGYSFLGSFTRESQTSFGSESGASSSTKSPCSSSMEESRQMLSGSGQAPALGWVISKSAPSGCRPRPVVARGRRIATLPPHLYKRPPGRLRSLYLQPCG